MSRWLAVSAALLSCGSFLLALRAAADLPGRSNVGAHGLRMRVEGTGSPTVLLEVGIHGPLEVWAPVQHEVSGFARVVAYDRLGAGNGEAILPGSQNVHQLHAALVASDIHPPFILVGHSLGAMYVRIFASLYPEEVAGILLLDPTQEQFFDWIAEHRPQDNPFHRNKNWVDGPSIRQTFEEVRGSSLPNVPVIVVTGARRPHESPHDAETARVWTRMHEEWVNTLPQGRHIISDQSGHGVQLEQPQLVVHLIHELVNRARQNPLVP